ncbi:DUF7475 family protein [Halobaculum litoreum]|uniref:Uncharacterized protein n=1 Tax=Halobaculum litoreum TaxID=3031998 RepID=A0ABD5XKY5_9EURY|nr:hypothetical protein [Halobaculum sp. DT92]
MSTETASEGLTLHTESMTGLHWLGVAMAAISGVIHLFLGVSFIDQGLGIAFLVAGVGFLVGAGAVLVDFRRRLFYAVGVPFTLGQIVIWLAVTPADEYLSPIGITDKVAQAVLIVVLVVLYRRAS